MIDGGFRWECTGCDYAYERRLSAATCCIAPGRPPDFTTARPIDEDGNEPEMWIGEKLWLKGENDE